MKKQIFLVLALQALVIFSTGELYAQENQDKIKEKEFQKQKEKSEKEKQKKELDSISEKVQVTYSDELKQLIEEQKKEQKRAQEELNEQIIQSYGDFSRSNGHSSGFNYRYRPGRVIVTTPMSFSGGSGNNTSFSISKDFDEESSFSSDFEYEVPGNVTGILFNFSSELEAGSLKLTITRPNGKVFQSFSVAPVANVEWNKQIQVKEEETKEYSGNWKITITTKDAKGYYELKINSY